MLGSALDGHNDDDAPLNDESCDTLYKEINPFVRFFYVIVTNIDYNFKLCTAVSKER